jgi:hypothetical protein
MDLVSPAMEEHNRRGAYRMNFQAATVEQALAEIAGSKDPLAAAVASALSSIPLKGASVCYSLTEKEIKERLFALISRRIAEGQDPAAVVEALVHVDEYLTARTGIARLFAVTFAPTAAALICHIDRMMRAERLEHFLAHAAPIIEIQRRTLQGVLIGPVKRSGAAIFADRVQGAVLRYRPKRFILIVRAATPGAVEVHEVMIQLRSDLEEQRIRVELDECPIGIDNESEKYYTGAGFGRNMEIQGSKVE